jgi:hypothetical protein
MAAMQLAIENLLGEKYHDSESRNVQREHCEDNEGDSRILAQRQ